MTTMPQRWWKTFNGRIFQQACTVGLAKSGYTQGLTSVCSKTLLCWQQSNSSNHRRVSHHVRALSLCRTTTSFGRGVSFSSWVIHRQEPVWQLTLQCRQCRHQCTCAIAHVHWYKHVPEREAMSAALGCPVFKTSFMDDSGGNLWPVQKLAPCRLGAVYHKTCKDRLVILSRFANFLELVPGVPSQGTQEVC